MCECVNVFCMFECVCLSVYARVSVCLCVRVSVFVCVSKCVFVCVCEETLPLATHNSV